MPEKLERKFVRMQAPAGMELPPEFFGKVELDIAGEHVAGMKIAKDLSKPADFVFIHGAAGGNYSRVMTFARPIVEQGSSIVAFDHSGHGESTGTEKHSSLRKRSGEAAAVIDAYAAGQPRTVCGSSMGGHVAIKMLEQYPVKNLILYCPAVYRADAYDLRFDSGFTELIREPESWRKTDAGTILQNFKGKLLVIIGSEDATIPKGVLELIDKNSSQTAKKEFLIVEGAPHAIHDWVFQHPDEAKRIADRVAEFSQ